MLMLCAGARPVRRQGIPACRRGAVSVLFAISSVALLGTTGLAIDYTIWNESQAQMALAATTAALEAAKVAGSALLAQDTTAVAISEGQAAGRQWFLAAVGTPYQTNANPPVPTVTVTPKGSAMVAQVTYTARVRSVFGGLLFGITSYNVSGAATSTVTTSPFVDVDFLVDNSSSMLIGAETADMQTMMEYSACYITQAGTQSKAGNFNGYGDNFNGIQYDGLVQDPLQAQHPPWDSSVTSLASNNTGNPFPAPTCKGQLPTISNGYDINGNPVNGPGGYYVAGQPCALACHDGGQAAGSGNDLFALARSLGVTLRYDVVKAALNAVLTQMQTDDTALHNLRTGIYQFNAVMTPVYPGGGAEAGDSWATAMAAVGTKPTGAGQAEPGYQPDNFLTIAGANHSDTDFPDAMIKLSQILTPAGDGTTATAPRKVLIILTDGLEDYNDNHVLGPFDTTKCDLLKGMGYTIFVLYTPYYPLMHLAYLGGLPTSSGATLPSIVENTGPGTDQYALKQCSSDPNNDFIAAKNTSAVTAALNTFLQSALNAPARLTQ